MTTAAELTAQFYGRSARFWGIRYDREMGGRVFKRNGFSCVCCTGFARDVQWRLGADRVEVRGFTSEHNPSSLIGRDCYGHDFAIVDGRFLVDPWALEVHGVGCGQVLDLEAPADAGEITRLYGDRSKWELLPLQEPELILKAKEKHD